MTVNPYESPSDFDDEGEASQAIGSPAARRRGRLIVAAVAGGVIIWDIFMLSRSDAAIIYLVIDLCVLSFMWSGSLVARWICALRITVPSLIVATAALHHVEIRLLLLAGMTAFAGTMLLWVQSVRAFFAHQRARKAQLLKVE